MQRQEDPRGSGSKKWVDHHIDTNRNNNLTSNIVRITDHEHRVIHRIIVREKKFRENYYVRGKGIIDRATCLRFIKFFREDHAAAYGKALATYRLGSEMKHTPIPKRLLSWWKNEQERR